MEAGEAERLRRTVREFLEESGVGGVVALSAYGSHVAGYARKDSDHDVDTRFLFPAPARWR
ncbi:TPA: hypothetical protein EYP38_00190 [Candidatus Micrarchaeota archaeon]|nr:hypothetical protein [Candidatus Micrarchaeota archaeon]